MHCQRFCPCARGQRHRKDDSLPAIVGACFICEHPAQFTVYSTRNCTETTRKKGCQPAQRCDMRPATRHAPNAKRHFIAETVLEPFKIAACQTINARTQPNTTVASKEPQIARTPGVFLEQCANVRTAGLGGVGVHGPSVLSHPLVTLATGCRFHAVSRRPKHLKPHTPPAYNRASKKHATVNMLHNHGTLR